MLARLFSWRLFRTWAVLTLLAALGAAPASAAVLSDDFNDGLPSPGLWAFAGTRTGPTVQEREGRLEFTLPATSFGAAFFASAETRPLFRGDLDVQVDFQLLQHPPHNGVRMGIVIHRDGHPFASVQRTSLGEGEPLGEPREAYILDTGTSLGRQASAESTGKLRLTRVGNTLTGYFWDAANTEWVPFATGTTTEEDLRFGLSAWSHDEVFADQDVRVAFDNFQVNQGQIVDPSLPDLEGVWLRARQRTRGSGANVQSTVEGRFAVRNTGDAPARPTLVRFYLSTDATLSPDDLPLYQGAVRRLNAGRATSVLFRTPLPRGVTAQGRYLIAVVDATNAVSETNEAGNAVAQGPLR